MAAVIEQEAVVTEKWLRKLPTPEPVPNMRAYTRQRWIALATSPRRALNYLKYKRALRDKVDLNYLPIKLDIENVSRCNFHCTMCQVSEWPKFKRADDMTLDDFKHLIDEQYGLVEIKLQGMGEPTLGGDTFFEMIRYARSKHLWVRTVTNASLLHLKDNYKKLIDSDPNEIQISIDGATKETFEKIRQGSRFEKVVENCKLINDYATKKGVVRTKMWTVLQRDNVHEMLQLVKLGAEMGFKTMVFSLNLTDWGQEKWHEVNAAVTVDRTLTREMIESAVDLGEKLGIRVAFWNITSKYSTDTSARRCPWPFERAYVSSDMRVVPCCMIANPDVTDLGDAKSFTSVWNSDTYREFRRSHIEGRLPKICQGCYEAAGTPSNN
jgi:MoaA/NifB/PqqE/SkfB family radical SAM enzyme